MKRIIIPLITLSALMPAISFAQTRQKLNLDKATVFISGAELLSTAKVTLVKGENELLFSNVAGNVNNQSIVVNATNGAVVESVTFQNNFTATDNVSPKVKEIKDSIERLEAREAPITNRSLTLDEQIAVLQANRTVAGSKTGLSVAELQKVLDAAGAKLELYLNQKDRVNTEIKKIEEHLVLLRQQLDEEQKKDYQPGGQLLVKLYAKENTSSNVTITYIVPNAGWSPTYDVWADDVKGPVRFFYKANIYQNSGVKWNNVKLTLSTGNPDEGMQAPVLSPWYLSFYVPDVELAAFRGARSGTYQWQQFQDDGTVEERDSTGHVAYQKADKTAAPSSMNDHVAVNNAGINTSYDIDLPYTIPSDGQEHLVAIKSYETPAIYEYYAAPKMDNDAFLLAKITNWEDMNLLPGRTNIFYEGTYVGQGSIDTRNIKDTMSISLGRDKKVVIKRERDKTRRSVKAIGTNVREEYAYNITIRNTRKEPVTIVVNDQIPVSNDKDIVLEDADAGGAERDEVTGLLKWMLTLKGNETKTLRFGFTLKYPKGKTIE